MVLSQHWLKHPPEKSIEWGGPFALASDGIGAGLASLVVTWSVCHSAWTHVNGKASRERGDVGGFALWSSWTGDARVGLEETETETFGKEKDRCACLLLLLLRRFFEVLFWAMIFWVFVKSV